MKHSAVTMDMEGGHKLVPLDEDVSLLFEDLSLIPFIFVFEIEIDQKKSMN